MNYPRRRAEEAPYEGVDRRHHEPGWAFLFRRLRSGAILGWLTVFAILLRLVGARFLSSGDAIDAVTHRVDVVSSQVDTLRTRMDGVAADAHAGVYLSCELLRRASPGTVLPETCKR